MEKVGFVAHRAYLLSEDVVAPLLRPLQFPLRLVVFDKNHRNKGEDYSDGCSCDFEGSRGLRIVKRVSVPEGNLIRSRGRTYLQDACQQR